MSIQQPLFINSFQKGSSENANIGFGTFLGVETYSKKGIAQLTKDTTKVSGSIITDLPIYFTSLNNMTIFCQGDSGKVYSSVDIGTTWVDITNPAGGSSGSGEGLFMYHGYLFAWRGVNIEYCVSPYTNANWTTWKTNNPPDFPLITGQHFPFMSPGDGILYFANGNFVGLIGNVGNTTFNPAGTIGVDYIYSTGPSNNEGSATIFGLVLPQSYQINCISFLPSNYLVLGTGCSGIGNSNYQIADIIQWNPTLSTYNMPLRLFSQAGFADNGVNQIINRNNIIYAVTGGNHAIFATNGSSFSLVEDISLYTTGRTLNGDGTQSTSPIFLNQYPSALAIMGNKLMTGVSTSVDSTPTGYGLFPLGVWSTAFTDEGNSTQCEFTISSGVICSKHFSIGSLYPVNQGQILIGWYDGTNYGIDKTEFINYQNDSSVVQIESQMFEIGTALNPLPITTIQYNLTRNLLTGQTITVYWRTGFDKAYQTFPAGGTFSGDGTKNSYKIMSNPIGATRFLQLRTEMSTGGSNLNYTPEIRNIVISGQ